MNKWLLLFYLFAPAIYAQGVKEGKRAQPVLFTIGTQVISNEEFTYLYKKNHQAKDSFSKESIEEYLDLFIKFKLKVAEAESRGMDTTKAFIMELGGYREELKRPYLAKEDDLDRLTRQAYQRMQEEVRASHILINLKPDSSPADTLAAYQSISEIKKKLAEGADFQGLARERSDDPSAKTNGGDLGYFTALQMVFPFEEAAYNGNVGSITNPIRTRFGYHLLKIVDKRQSRGQVEVSHILIRGETGEAKKTIDGIHDRLQNGEEWSELCKLFSQDPGTKDAGGKLKPFGAGALSSAPTFEETAFSLDKPGSISKPIQTPFGWHIVKLERKIPIPSYEEMEESLKRRIARDERMEISKSKALEERKRKLKYSENAETKSALLALADSTLSQGKWMVRNNSINNEILFHLESKPYLVSNFAKYVRLNQRATNQDPTAYLKQMYDQFVEKTLVEAEDVQLQREHPEYRRLVNEYREGILLFSIMEDEVWIKASDDSIGQRNYYENNKESYKASDRVQARVFADDDSSFLTSMKSKLIAGDTLQKSEGDKFAEVSGLKAYEKGDHDAVDKIDWTVGWHETEANGMYYLVEVKRIIPPEFKDFEEVRANVISDYQDYLERNWIQTLRDKYPVEVNKKSKKLLIKTILSKNEQ